MILKILLHKTSHGKELLKSSLLVNFFRSKYLYNFVLLYHL